MATGKRNAATFAGNVLRYAQNKAEIEMREQQERDEWDKPFLIGKLKTVQDTSKFLARVLRSYMKGNLDSTKAYRAASIARMLSNNISLGDLETRLEQLEDGAKLLKNKQFERPSAQQAGDNGETAKQSEGNSGSDNTPDNAESGKQVDLNKPEGDNATP